MARIMVVSQSSTHWIGIPVPKIYIISLHPSATFRLLTGEGKGDWTSCTASVADWTEGKEQMATCVGSKGMRRRVASVMIPRVPSAPMKSFVASNTAEDFLERAREARKGRG